MILENLKKIKYSYLKSLIKITKSKNSPKKILNYINHKISKWKKLNKIKLKIKLKFRKIVTNNKMLIWKTFIKGNQFKMKKIKNIKINFKKH